MSFDEEDDYESAAESQPETPAAPIPLPDEVEIKFSVYTRQMQDAVLANVARQVERLFEAKVAESIESAVQGMVDHIARDRIEAAVTQVLSEGWTITNDYGEARGKASLKDRISKLLDQRNSYRGDRWVDDIIQKETREALNGALKKEIDAAAAKLREEVDLVTRAKLNEVLRKSLGLTV